MEVPHRQNIFLATKTVVVMLIKYKTVSGVNIQLENVPLRVDLVSEYGEGNQFSKRQKVVNHVKEQHHKHENARTEMPVQKQNESALGERNVKWSIITAKNMKIPSVSVRGVGRGVRYQHQHREQHRENLSTSTGTGTAKTVKTADEADPNLLLLTTTLHCPISCW